MMKTVTNDLPYKMRPLSTKLYGTHLLHAMSRTAAATVPSSRLAVCGTLTGRLQMARRSMFVRLRHTYVAVQRRLAAAHVVGGGARGEPVGSCITLLPTPASESITQPPGGRCSTLQRKTHQVAVPAVMAWVAQRERFVFIQQQLHYCEVGAQGANYRFDFEALSKGLDGGLALATNSASDDCAPLVGAGGTLDAAAPRATCQCHVPRATCHVPVAPDAFISTPLENIRLAWARSLTREWSE